MQEAAVDADRVYLAAIDKFDAMMSWEATLMLHKVIVPFGWPKSQLIFFSRNSIFLKKNQYKQCF